MTCCGMQEGELHLLARVLNAPFTLQATVRFSGEAAEMTVSGVGPEAKTITLKRKHQ